MWSSKTVTRPGARPGQLRQEAAAARLICARYQQDQLDLQRHDKLLLPTLPADGEMLWLDIEGVPGHEGLGELQQRYGLHQLALEDVQNGGQNPKLEFFDEHLYLVLQLPRRLEDGIVFEQLNLFLAPGLVISIHQRAGLFDPVRERLESGRGVIRGAGAEYLLYALCDLAVDLAIPVAQSYAETLLELEDRVEDGEADLSQDIYSVRRQLSALQRQTLRQRDQLLRVLQPEHELLSGSHALFWRDCVDHAERLHENVTYQRESAADLLNTHLALISHRMNDVMKVLTVMSTVFVPLSFLVGLYGMNFDTSSPYNLPELGWRFGYVFVWGVMLAVVGGVLWFFRRKRWI